jgi:ATP-binding cassette subfamily G (WHITE) protein 2 (SNQ2)
MASNELPTPAVDHLPGGWMETPAASHRRQSYIGSEDEATTPHAEQGNDGTFISNALHTTSANYYSGQGAGLFSESSDQTATPSPEIQENVAEEPVEMHEILSDASSSEDKDSDKYESIKPASQAPIRPALQSQQSKPMTEDDLFRVLSRRRTSQATGINRTATRDSAATASSTDEEQDEINKLMSRMFGHTRQEASEEEKTRHVGVVFKHLTVKGMGLGAALQPSVGDLFLNPIRFVKNLVTRGPRQAAGKPPVRTIIDDFSGCVKPAEMLLVLGRPGSGCSTFLKILGNQRFGFEEITGDVTYGGTDAEEMGKKYRSEILYNPEDDLHYATLKVKDTISFALKTRTPGKDSRKEGESRNDYVKEFLRVVTKLFWIEHTLDTKVGNEFIRGVSGGEKKRVSIAEAMITKASVQSWDNSTRGLDASTALEYVQSLRSLTNMANISTSVALYQAGESLFDLFDKVLLIHEGRCYYFGPADHAAAYFKNLGFVQPERWTTADFLTSVTDDHERHIKEGWEDRIPRTSAQFGKAFFESKQYQDNFAEIEEWEGETQRQLEKRQAATTKATKKKNFTLSFPKQVMACTKRQFLVMVGDPQSLGGKWGVILFQALIVGSLFYNLPNTAAGVFPRGGVIFFMLLFNALLALAELTSAFESKPILLKRTLSIPRDSQDLRWDILTSPLQTAASPSTGPPPTPSRKLSSTYPSC